MFTIFTKRKHVVISPEELSKKIDQALDKSQKVMYANIRSSAMECLNQFDKNGNKMTKLGYLLNKDDLEGLSPEDYADLFEARRFARKRRIGEDAQAFSGETKGMKFSKERMFYNSSDKKFYRQKNDKTDAIVPE